MNALLKVLPRLLVAGFWPLELGLADWLLIRCSLPCRFAACWLYMLRLVGVVLLLLMEHFLLGRLVGFLFAICNRGLGGSIVLIWALSPPCLNCCCSASLQVAPPSTLGLPLMDMQALMGRHFGPAAAAFPEDLCIVSRIQSSRFRVVRPERPIFHSASWRATGLFYPLI